MTATSHPPPATPPEGTLGVLAAERDFLLRSLADLEAEHAAGELTDSRFAELHDHYTVQAATVLRAIERLEASEVVTEAVVAGTAGSRRRLVLAALAAVAVAAAGAGLLTRSLGDRQPGQSITGNAQIASPDLDQLARAAGQRPGDYDAQMVYASALMQAGRAVDALRAFDAASRVDPAAPAPMAYSGWIVFLAGLTDEALPRIDAAIAADPDYPDARFFRGIALLRGRNDPEAALVELRRFLALAPPGPERDQVQQLVEGITANSTTTTTSAR